ncbi:S8 family peptidase [Nocardioides sp. Kera G14]|uniref:S8 family peptidase n=1 Tax=Nocardioides sp. Kera G14 TaxID=2884264 RepID=UPI001D11AAA5|nr:S8 family serine peptidase [Nocardioides sp. Kera G14]UDY22313.1 S8 family serine peptidase [Nocardioides sp. Kera G14]
MTHLFGRPLPAVALTTLTAAALACSTIGAASAASADGDGEGTPAQVAPYVAASPAIPSTKLSAALSRTGRQTVFVQLAGDGAVDAGSKAAATARRKAVSTDAASVVKAAKAEDSKLTTLYTVSNAVPGVAVSADPAAIAALAAQAQVVKVTPIVPKTLSNASSATLTNALATWQSLGNTGTGVTIGVIDSGIDYTHADFGGAGTTSAYDRAHAASDQSFTPTAKVVGGHDFVGDDYQPDPSLDGFQPVPEPDEDPLDCSGHGTHVAGTAAGYGVNADGSTFTGSYKNLDADKLAAMKVGPGMAPGASLVALKIFGCTGPTTMTIPALDWALDPNGDGDFSDHLDIVNLSSGSDEVPADDPDNAVIEALAAHGVLPVVANGNAGDLTDISGSPANAPSALAVASSVDAFSLADGLRVDAPASVAGTVVGQFSVNYDWASASPVSAPVVALSAGNTDGCDPLSAADASRVAGKIVWLEWDEDDATRRCGSTERDAVHDAGAVGAIFTSGVDSFDYGIAGSTEMPIVQITATATARLRPALEAGTLAVTFDPALAGTVPSTTPGLVDTLSTFSSRGGHGSVGVVKPDLTAPGDTIVSAGVGSGSGATTLSGTSQAAPHVAGIAALVQAAHPGWSPEELKADLMNTADHDLYTGTGQSGAVYGPARVGSGRVDAAAAVGNSLLAYSADDTGAVSLSFGVLAVPITTKKYTATRELTLANKGTHDVTASVGYAPATTQPGVTFSGPGKVTVKAGRTTTVTIKVTVTPGALRRTIDPTMAETQTNPYFGTDEARQFVADASGRVMISTSTGAELRVPVYAAAKPTAATSTTVSKKGSSLLLKGTGVLQGEGTSAYTSLVSVLQLGATSGKLSQCSADQLGGCWIMDSERGGDLRYVGAGSVKGDDGYADGLLWFGLNSWGQWPTLDSTIVPFVDFDVDGDGAPDYEVYAQSMPSTDLLYAWTVDLNTGDLVGLMPVNLNDGSVDTNVFDSDTLLLPVSLSALGVPADTESLPITYQAGTFSLYDGALMDLTDPADYDVADPSLAVDAPLYLDAGGSAIGFTLASGTTSAQALVLHLQGAPGERAEVVTVGDTKTQHRTKPQHKRAPFKGTWHKQDKHFHAPAHRR